MNRQQRAEIFLVITGLIWGGTFVATKMGLTGVAPLWLLFFRFAATALLFSLVFLRRLTLPSRRGLRAGILLGLLMFMGYGMQTLGLKYTSVAKSSLITYLYALLVPPLQLLLTRKKLHLGNILGLVIVFGGLFLFSTGGAEGLSGWNRGDTITLIGAAAYAFYIVLLDILPARQDPLQLTGIQFFVTALLAGAAAILFEEPRFSFTPLFWGSLAYLVVLGSIVVIMLMNLFQQDTTPTKACLIYALEPLFAVFLGWIILGETLTPGEITGSLLILAGILFSETYPALFRMKKKLKS